jgi:hypothetical protein
LALLHDSQGLEHWKFQKIQGAYWKKKSESKTKIFIHTLMENSCPRYFVIFKKEHGSAILI